MTSHLPEELLVNVLARLSVKSLKRFHCIHKSWYNLLQNRYFVDIHFNISKKNVCYLIKGKKHLPPDYEYSATSLVSIETLDITSEHNIPFHGINLGGIAYVLGCTNGIVCVINDAYKRYGAVMLWNPATKDYKVVREHKNNDFLIYGFGYDYKTYDYKVVRIPYSRDEETFEYKLDVLVDVYSLNSDSWRTFKTLLPALPVSGLPFQFSLYLDGAFHWWARLDIKNEAIISFDMRTEEFILTRFPNGVYFGNVYSDTNIYHGESWFMVLNGSIARLYCPVNLESNPERIFDVWVLGKLGVAESWTKSLIIGPVLADLDPLAAHENGVFFFHSYTGSEVECYDSITQTMKPFKIKFQQSYLWAVIKYEECLGSLRR